MAKIPKGTFEPDVINRKRLIIPGGDPLHNSKKVSMPKVPDTPKLGDIPNSRRIPVNADSNYKQNTPKPKKDNEGEYTTSTEKKQKYNPFRKKK